MMMTLTAMQPKIFFNTALITVYILYFDSNLKKFQHFDAKFFNGIFFVLIMCKLIFKPIKNGGNYECHEKKCQQWHAIVME